MTVAIAVGPFSFWHRPAIRPSKVFLRQSPPNLLADTLRVLAYQPP